jgi:hypothetical protein
MVMGENVGYAGIEIMDADTVMRKDFLLSLPFLPALLLKPKFALLKFIYSPQRTLRKWDELNKMYSIYGYFSADAHLLYLPLLNFLRLHLIRNASFSSDFHTARHQVFEALRSGRFYNSIHAAAWAEGLRFWGESGKEFIPVGGTALLKSGLTFHIQAPFPFCFNIYSCDYQFYSFQL